jgi:hypothetical protein
MRRNGRKEAHTEEIVSEEADHGSWTVLPLEKLTALQGVQPADDLDQISALWPVDDDPDRLLAHVLAERAARTGQIQHVVERLTSRTVAASPQAATLPTGETGV